ncbi:hypothetical protein C5748_20225 [Phyllobacterium phragmitis]|uniref:Uncharacterized protein n=1 Tax=Phyllobacterium phragmitis TaxID=2670329 RepID=A0A2S9IM59_9HYPH|nr:hypothetical protein [Phyllobacterium phragmitis]PRD41611.1 hypothetical protein C5748_20225 [Phyllobacterium phragmitis]
MNVVSRGLAGKRTQKHHAPRFVVSMSPSATPRCGYMKAKDDVRSATPETTPVETKFPGDV